MFLCETLVLRTEGARFVARDELRSRTFQIFHSLRSTRWCCRYTISLLRSAAADRGERERESNKRAYHVLLSDARDAKIYIEFTGTANLSRKWMDDGEKVGAEGKAMSERKIRAKIRKYENRKCRFVRWRQRKKTITCAGDRVAARMTQKKKNRLDTRRGSPFDREWLSIIETKKRSSDKMHLWIFNISLCQPLRLPLFRCHLCFVTVTALDHRDLSGDCESVFRHLQMASTGSSSMEWCLCTRTKNRNKKAKTKRYRSICRGCHNSSARRIGVPLFIVYRLSSIRIFFYELHTFGVGYNLGMSTFLIV